MRNIEGLYSLVDLINQAYVNKDVDSVSDLVSNIFSEDASIIIGTSLNEICLGKDEVIKLFKSDFDGWGTFFIDKESCVVNEVGNLLLADFKAKLSIEFNVNDKTYENFCNEVKFINNKNQRKKKSSLDILWLMMHLLYDREEGARKYLWDFEFTLILDNSNQNPKILLMHFSYPFKQKQYDVVLNDDEYFDNEYNKELNTLNNSEQLDKDLSKYLEESLTNKYKEISLNCSKLNIGDEFFFYGVGTYTNIINFELEYDNIIKEFEQSQLSNKEKLFHLSKDLIYIYQQSHIDKRTLPIRIVGVGLQNGGEYIIKHYKITYPYMIILENKSKDDILLSE